MTSPDSELSLVLKSAAEAGETILIDTGEGLYELDVLASDHDQRDTDEEPDAILGLIGIGNSVEPTHVARCKDSYLAEAYDHRKR